MICGRLKHLLGLPGRPRGVECHVGVQQAEQAFHQGVILLLHTGFSQASCSLPQHLQDVQEALLEAVVRGQWHDLLDPGVEDLRQQMHSLPRCDTIVYLVHGCHGPLDDDHVTAATAGRLQGGEGGV